MACDGSCAALLAVYYLLTSDGLVVKSSDSSLQLTIYKRCTMDLKLRGKCRSLVTFSNCMERSMIKTGLKGHGAEALQVTTSARDRREWDGGETDLISTDGQKVLVHPCSCNTSVDDIANIKADFYNEWARLVPHVSRSEKVCLLELVDLFRGSNDACSFQNTKAAANIRCQLPLNQTGPSCLWTWSRLRPCNGFQTRTLRHQVCICAFRRKILQSDLQTDISLDEKTLAAPMQETVKDELSDVEVNSFDAELLYDGRISVDEHLCPNGASHANCTRMVYERSAETNHCSAGHFGNACEQRCRCMNKASCDRSTGTCDFGCEIGWKGSSCNQRVCPDHDNISYYGVLLSGEEECWLQCMCSNGKDCNVLNGECMIGSCPNTEDGNICADQVCPRRYIRRPDCATKCYCYGDMVCNPLTGKCPGNLCRRGYLPPDCTKKKTILLAGAQGVLVIIQVIVVAMKIAIAFHLRVIPMFL